MYFLQISMAANLIDKEDKQPNVNLDSREKALLLEIIKEADGGKVCIYKSELFVWRISIFR